MAKLATSPKTQHTLCSLEEPLIVAYCTTHRGNDYSPMVSLSITTTLLSPINVANIILNK